MIILEILITLVLFSLSGFLIFKTIETKLELDGMNLDESNRYLRLLEKYKNYQDAKHEEIRELRNKIEKLKTQNIQLKIKLLEYNDE